ncbi:MAG: hypothetical protein HON90_09920, partial [Halobacteriovoraceae bacterium]|nr:hypothetical protein [Halobacteriovoraceae bacterium]
FLKEKKLPELEICTGLKKEVLSNTINLLITRNLITIRDKHYYLNNHLNTSIRSELKDDRNISIEVHEIISACLRLSKIQKNFSLKKVYMNKKEENIFQGHLINLESFLNSLDNKNNKTSEQKIIFWGGENYGKIINNTLNY